MNILVSGGSKGLGLEICKKLARDDKKIIITFARTETKEIRELLRSYKNFSFYEFDLDNLSEIKSFIKKINADFGLIDALINNAAVGTDGILATLHDSQIQSSISINITSQILLTKYCVKNMLLRKHGNIINISSILADTGFNGLSVYAFAKSGQVGFTKSLARELGKVNIRVNAILPGFMETDMTSGISDNNLSKIINRSPMSRLPNTSSVANLTSFLLSDEACDIHGECIKIDCGATS